MKTGEITRQKLKLLKFFKNYKTKMKRNWTMMTLKREREKRMNSKSCEIEN